MDREEAGHISAGMGDADTERPPQVSDGHVRMEHVYYQIIQCNC